MDVFLRHGPVIHPEKNDHLGMLPLVVQSCDGSRRPHASIPCLYGNAPITSRPTLGGKRFKAAESGGCGKREVGAGVDSLPTESVFLLQTLIDSMRRGSTGRVGGDWLSGALLEALV
jgi:hypothetical protein